MSANRWQIVVTVVLLSLAVMGCAEQPSSGTARAAATTAGAHAEATQEAATAAGTDAAAKEGAADAAERAKAGDAVRLRSEATIARRVSDELDRRAKDLAAAAKAKAKDAEAEDRDREAAAADQARQERAWLIGMGGVILGGLVGLLLWRLTTLREGLAMGGGIAAIGTLAAGYGAVSPWVFGVLFLAAAAGGALLLWRQGGLMSLTATLSKALDAGEAARMQNPLPLERAMGDLATAIAKVPGAATRFRRLRSTWRPAMGLPSPASQGATP